MFKKKRKIYISEDSKMEDEDLLVLNPEIIHLGSVEKVEVLTEKIIKSTEDKEISSALEFLPVLIRDDWNEKYFNIFLNKTLMNKLNDILQNGNLRNKWNILRLLININYWINVTDKDAEWLIDNDFIQTIFGWLELPENQQIFITDTYKKAIWCLTNLCYNYPTLPLYLLENSLLPVLQELLGMNVFLEDCEFRNWVVGLLDAVLRTFPKWNSEDIKIFEHLVTENLILNKWFPGKISQNVIFYL